MSLRTSRWGCRDFLSLRLNAQSSLLLKGSHIQYRFMTEMRQMKKNKYMQKLALRKERRALKAGYRSFTGKEIRRLNRKHDAEFSHRKAMEEAVAKLYAPEEGGSSSASESQRDLTLDAQAEMLGFNETKPREPKKPTRAQLRQEQELRDAVREEKKLEQHLKRAIKLNDKYPARKTDADGIDSAPTSEEVIPNRHSNPNAAAKKSQPGSATHEPAKVIATQHVGPNSKSAINGKLSPPAIATQHADSSPNTGIVKEKSAQMNLRESKILARANRSQEGRPATASGREEERPDGKIAEERGPESSESISKEVFAKYQTPVQQAAVRQPPIIVSAVTETHESHIPKPAPTKVVFSGIQPTGIPHLGNYLGALRGWTKLQDEADANTRLIFSLVDLHAITIQQDPKQLRQWRRESFAMLAAIGLDIQKSTIFHQSDVPAHSELMWILSCQASMGYLGRMTQWKDKTQNEAADSGKLKLGLFSYPVLQAADILVHGTTHVPVGEDQSQHLEFARELANGFNHLAKKPILIPPTTIISPAKRVRSLTDPSLKMSKSFPNPKSRILLTDDEATIGAKIRSAVTDSQTGVTYDPDTRPGVSNLVDLLYYADPEFQPVEDEHAAKVALAADIQNLSMKDFKTRVADVLDAMICPIRERYAAAMAKSKEEVETDAQVGAAKARQSADVVLKKVKRAIGLC